MFRKKGKKKTSVPARTCPRCNYLLERPRLLTCPRCMESLPQAHGCSGCGKCNTH